MNAFDSAHFKTFGFVVLRAALPADALRGELVDALSAPQARPLATGVANVQYVPMMTSRTPVSLVLLDKFEATAASLLGGPVLPIRAKGMRYFGSTRWHTDSSRPIESVGFAAYLEHLAANDGALRVLPGSHRRDYGYAAEAVIRAMPEGAPVDLLPGVPVATAPGDVIVFDEHLYHASTGGTERLQWRVDYIRDPISCDEEKHVREYFAQVFSPEWDGGYDAEAFPSYGADWLASGRASVERLQRLGVYALAEVQETLMRSRRAANRR